MVAGCQAMWSRNEATARWGQIRVNSPTTRWRLGSPGTRYDLSSPSEAAREQEAPGGFVPHCFSRTRNPRAVGTETAPTFPFEVTGAKTLTHRQFVVRAQDRLWADDGDRSQCPQGGYVAFEDIAKTTSL
jgi:hypothetical protein